MKLYQDHPDPMPPISAHSDSSPINRSILIRQGATMKGHGIVTCLARAARTPLFCRMPIKATCPAYLTYRSKSCVQSKRHRINRGVDFLDSRIHLNRFPSSEPIGQTSACGAISDPNPYLENPVNPRNNGDPLSLFY